MINRREFSAVVFGGIASCVQGAERPVIIDTHTHFYDPSRPEGVDWPGKDDKVLYRPVLPSEFVKLVQPHGVTGTMVIEASPRLKDNDWLLDLADVHPVIYGVVGRLDLADDQFAEHLQRFAKRSKYRGFRINHGDLAKHLSEPKQIAKLSKLIDLGLALDINGGPELLPTLIEVAKKFPKLSIVLNHMANAPIDGKTVRKDWKENILKLSDHTNVTCKLSALVESSGKSDGTAPKEIGFYRLSLDVVWKAFGENRLMFGSNWPVSDRFASYQTIFSLMQQFLADFSPAIQTKIWSGNAIKAYDLTVPK